MTAALVLRRAAPVARMLLSTDRILRAEGLASARAALGRSGVSGVSFVDPREHARMTILLIARLARVLPGNLSCLRQALVAERVLRADGLDPAVVIGVARSGPGDYRMHAWIELDGVPVTERADTLAPFRRSLVL